MEEQRLQVVWTGGKTIWATDCKVQPMHSTDVTWSLYQRRSGLMRRLLPLPVFLHDFLPGNEAMVCDKLGIGRCGHAELVRRYEANEFHDSKEEESTEEKVSSLFDKTNAELREMCEERGLPVYGAKDVLVERLEAS